LEFASRTGDEEGLEHVMRRVAAVLKAGEPLPAGLHERALRLQLAEHPDDANCIRSLIALLHVSGRAPMPDDAVLASVTRRPGTVEPLEASLQSVPNLLLNEDIWGAYTVLWQGVMRYPDSPRPWAEYAWNLSERNEWTYAAMAAGRTLAHPACGETPTSAVLLDALSALAESSQLSPLDWRPWFESLPAELHGHRAYARFLLAIGRDQEADRASATVVRRDPTDAKAWLVASMAAYRIGNFPECYDFYRRSLQIDVKQTLAFSIRTYSAQIDRVVQWLNKADELGEWLTQQSSAHAELNMLPEANGVEFWAKSRRMRQLALDKGLPSPLLITQGKSGSISIGRIFASGFALPSVLYSFVTTRVIAPWLQDYLLGGACYVTHLLPTARNQELLRSGGKSNIIVHIRDPRQIMISTLEHGRAYSHQLTGAEIGEDQTAQSDPLEVAVEKHLTPAISWIDGWFRASETMEINFTSFEEFVTDQDAFYEKMLSFYGGDRIHFDRTAATVDQPNVDYHRRLGQTNEWRRLLTPSQIDRVNAAIPAHLWTLFGWTP
jgi:tetratricopeptide (TPR) repeat protein